MPELDISHLLIILGMIVIFLAMVVASERFGDHLGSRSDRMLDELTQQLKSGAITQKEFDERRHFTSMIPPL